MNTDPSTLSSQMLQVLNCQRSHLSSGGANIYAQAYSFFSDLTNMPATQEAISRYGQPSCSTDWIITFAVYIAAFYFKEFPLPSPDPANCALIKSLIAGVQNEQVNVQTLFTTGTAGDQNWLKYHQIPLSDRLNDLNSLYSQTNCTQNINQQTTVQDIALLQSAQANQPTAAGGTTGTPWLVYGIVGMAVVTLLIAGTILWPKNKK